MLTSKPELSLFNSHRSLESILGLAVVEDLSLWSAEHSVSLNMDIASEYPVENQTVSIFSLHRMAGAAFLATFKVKVNICLRGPVRAPHHSNHRF